MEPKPAIVDKAKIRSLPIFAHLAEIDFDDVHRAAVRRSFGAGTNVIEQGDEAANFFVLLEGRLRVTQVPAEGQQIIVRIVNPGELFGIAKALQRTDCPGTATAVSDRVVLYWPMGKWSDFMGSYHGDSPAGGPDPDAELATEEVERRVPMLYCGWESSRVGRRPAASASTFQCPSRTSPK